MASEKSAREQGTTAIPSVEKLKYKGIEHLRMLYYQREASEEGARRAFDFFGNEDWGGDSSDDDSSYIIPSSEGESTDDDSSYADSSNEGDPSDEETSTENTTTAPVGARDDSVSEIRQETASRAEDGSSTPTEGGRETVTSPEQRDMAGDDAPPTNARDGVGAEASQSIADADEPADSAARAWYEQKLAVASAQLVLAQQRLSMMHRQAMHCSQELEVAVHSLKRARASNDAEEVQGGTYPFLVHYGSAPFIKSRICFDEPFEAPPKVVVGIQTSDPSAMALVFASDIDTKGFTVHADLANDTDFENETDLLKCLIIWMAVGNGPSRNDDHCQTTHDNQNNNQSHHQSNDHNDNDAERAQKRVKR